MTAAMAPVQSVLRSWSLLTKVAEHADQPLGLVGLAEAVDLPTSTAARLLSTLEAVEAVRRDERGVYRIGPTIAAIGSSLDAEPTLRTVAHPHMVELVALTDEAVGLAVRVAHETVTIAQVDAPRSVQAEDWSGSRWPLHLGGSGDVLMTTWDRADIHRHLVEVAGLDEAGAARVRSRIDTARTSGVAWSRGDYVADLSSVAAPILDGTRRAVAALYVYGPSYRFPDPDTRVRVEELLRDRAQRVSAAWTARRGWSRRATDQPNPIAAPGEDSGPGGRS
ncbi:IclR family transcriptional regulator [Euzebya tangerina]|uniref:IclR family transcriptional regulator n=1 Tax=Euzebya tangerina TaxID=591198 RepID=UPI00196B4A9C|nr:IclR family transcriptional regulator [Euzebya tangerina]